MDSFNQYIINGKNIKHNLLQCRKNIKTKICAVIKADGYGIGANYVIDEIDDVTDCYAVACFVEAKKAREFTSKPILVLNFVSLEDLCFCVNNNIAISISSLNQLKMIKTFLKNNCEQFSGKLKLHLAINTGMNRIGFSDLIEFEKTLLFIKRNLKYMIIDGIFTHFCNAENIRFTKKQNRIFMQYLKLLSLHYDISKITRHACNSLAALKYKEFHYDMVRLGVVLYGGMHDKELEKIYNFKNTLNIKSRVIAINKIKKGDCVGYNKGFIAKRNMIVATIPIGYADGIFRKYSKKGKVIINGNLCKIVGNICMDMFMVDVSKNNVKLFDEVIFLGGSKKNTIDINEMANHCETISYEILTNIKKNRFEVKIKN